MSLFRAKEWWSTKLTDTDTSEGFDGALLCSANFFGLDCKREQLIVGSDAGRIWVFDPGFDVDDSAPSATGAQNVYRAEHLLHEERMGAPLCQIGAGRFVTGAQQHQLAVLYQRKLAVYAFSSIESTQSEHGKQYSLKRLYEHLLHRSAYNMVWGPFGGITGRDFLCVQSIDGALSFFEQETFAFSRFLPGSLLPGPLCYVPLSDSFITLASSWQLESYKYQTLAVAAESKTKEEAVNLTTGKKVTPDWVYQLGENALSVQVVEISPAQPSVVVLGERTVVCLTEGGTVRFLNKLRVNPLLMLAYSSTSEGYIQYLIGTDTNTIMVYADTILTWTAQVHYAPLILLRTTFGPNFKQFLTSMSEVGEITVTYLGTDPSLFGLPQTDVRHIDFAAKQKELKKLQAIIRGDTKSYDVKGSDDFEVLTIQCVPPTSLDNVSAAHDSKVTEEELPSATVRVTLTCHTPIENVQLFPVAQHPLAASQNCFSFSTITGKKEVTVSFYMKFAGVPVTNTVTFYATYVNRNGQNRIATAQCILPLRLICRQVAGSKSALHKITLQSNKPTTGLDVLYSELGVGFDATHSIGFQCYGLNTSVVSILVSKNAQKYRVQSDTFESILVFLSDFLRRLKSRETDVRITFEGIVPVAELIALIDHHFELQKRHVKLHEILEQRCVQIRAVQKQLLTKLKDTTPTPLAHLDGLLEMTYRQLTTIAGTVADLSGHIHIKGAAVASASRLVLHLLKLQHSLTDDHFAQLVSAVAPPFDEYHQQTWEERVDASLAHILQLLGKSHASVSPLGQQVSKLTDTGRLKRHLALLCDRIANGATLPSKTVDDNAQAKPDSSSSKPAALAVSAPPPIRVPGGRLETIVEDTNASDATDSNLGDATVPAGSAFGAVISGSMTTNPELKEVENSASHADNDDFSAHAHQTTTQLQQDNPEEQQLSCWRSYGRRGGEMGFDSFTEKLAVGEDIVHQNAIEAETEKEEETPLEVANNAEEAVEERAEEDGDPFQDNNVVNKTDQHLDETAEPQSHVENGF